MTRNEMRSLAKQIISDAAAVVTAAYAGQEHRPDITTAALLAHYVLLEFPPEDSEPVFTLEEVEAIRYCLDNGDWISQPPEVDIARKAVKAALRKLKGKE